MTNRTATCGKGSALLIVLASLAGCALGDLPHGNLGMPADAGSPFNGRDYADPNPHSASDDAQRAAYQRHQQEQNDAAARASEPDLSTMTCTGTSSSATAANAGSLTSSTNCHN